MTGAKHLKKAPQDLEAFVVGLQFISVDDELTEVVIFLFSTVSTDQFYQLAITSVSMLMCNTFCLHMTQCSWNLNSLSFIACLFMFWVFLITF